MATLLRIIFAFSLWVLPFVLAWRRWSSRAIGYTVAAITTFIAIILGGSTSEGVIRVPSLPILMLEVVSGTLISGTIIWGIVALVRKVYARLRTKKTSEDVDKRPETLHRPD